MIRSGIGWPSRRRASRFVRAGTLALALASILPGVWALFSPLSFFNDFPGGGLGWVAGFPPYNEHLVRDLGSFYVGFAALLALAAGTADRTAIRVALAGFIVFTIPHLVFHAQHPVGEGIGQRFGSVIALGAAGLLALVLFGATFRSERH